MTRASTISKVSYAGDDSTVEFPITFQFAADADILAVLTDALGVETELTLTTDYTLTGAGDASGGQLTIVGTTPATGETLTIKRSPSITQLTDYTEFDAFPAESHEAALDKLTDIAQDHEERLSRTVELPVWYSGDTIRFPNPEAGAVLLWNAGETAIENGPIADQIISAQGYATAAAASAAAAAASAATVPDFPAITGEGGKYVKINAGGTAIEYDALGTAAQVDTGTASGNVPLLTTGGAMALAGQLDLSGASSGQIAFPATQNPSSDANTLDDYEEGTFTPTIIGTTAAGTGTYTTQNGAYVKIGKVVYCSIQLVTTAHTGTGNMRISGLPYMVGRTMGSVAGYIDALTITGVLEANAIAGGTQLYLYSINNGTSAPLALDAACTINVNFFYFV